MARTLALAFAAAAILAGGASASRRIAGGSSIGIEQAPWAVFVQDAAASGKFICTGSIVDASHVLTAAHCLYDDKGVVSPPAALSVRAGVSNFSTPLATDLPQDRQVSAYRVHPGYAWTSRAAPDDVAVLVLSAPLDLTGPNAQAASLPSPVAPYPTGASAGLAGFGRPSPTANASGPLAWLTETVDEQGTCGGPSSIGAIDDDAIILCASSPGGAACNGDSGSGLVTSDTHVLLGVVSAGAASCDTGSHTLFTYVGASEVLSFIQGNDQPPTAPRETSATTLELRWDPPLVVGSTLSCTSTNWNGAPRLTFDFVDTRNGDVLQHGPTSTYRLLSGDAGRAVICRVSATNPGGSALDWTVATGAVRPAPQVVIGKLPPIQATPGSEIVVHVMLHVPAGLRGKFGVCVTLPAAVGGRACTSTQDDSGASGAYPFALRFRIAATAPRGAVYAAIAAIAGASTAQGRALLRVAPPEP